MAKSKKTVKQIIGDMPFAEEVFALREIMLTTPMEETIKWGIPVYTYHGKNLVGISGFKHHFGVWFYQGALLSDPKSTLINVQEGKTKAMRQWRMNHMQDIDVHTLKAYLEETIRNETEGNRILANKPIRKAPKVPAELEAALKSSARLKNAFSKLTPGKQKMYAEYISSAKRAATKSSRIQKIKPMILAGAGLNDKYVKK